MVHDELQMMEAYCAHYMELCVTLRKEEEIKEESTRLKTIVKEVMIVVSKVELEEDQPLEVGLSRVKEVV